MDNNRETIQGWLNETGSKADMSGQESAGAADKIETLQEEIAELENPAHNVEDKDTLLAQKKSELQAAREALHASNKEDSDNLEDFQTAEALHAEFSAEDQKLADQVKAVMAEQNMDANSQYGKFLINEAVRLANEHMQEGLQELGEDKVAEYIDAAKDMYAQREASARASSAKKIDSWTGTAGH